MNGDDFIAGSVRGFDLCEYSDFGVDSSDLGGLDEYCGEGSGI